MKRKTSFAEYERGFIKKVLATGRSTGDLMPQRLILMRKNGRGLSEIFQVG